MNELLPDEREPCYDCGSDWPELHEHDYERLFWYRCACRQITGPVRETPELAALAWDEQQRQLRRENAEREGAR